MATAKEQDIGSMTVEELIALGFDKETAEKMLKYSGNEGGGGIFAPILSFNYDKDDVLGDSGVAKKGDFITGYKINRSTLTLEEEGTNYGSEIEFIVFASAYQYSAYDNTKNTSSVASNIFLSSFDAKKAVDMKSGKPISELQKTNDKIKFANILGLLVKTPDGWVPHAFYSRGANSYELNKQLEAEGIDSRDLPNAYRLKVRSKKIPTKGTPAWIMDVRSCDKLTITDLLENKDVIAENINKFDSWVRSVNTVNAQPSSDSSAPAEELDGVLKDDDIDV
jgi:hypothetical protein